MLNLSRIATRVAITTVAGLLSACSAISFGIANAPAKFGPFERKADIAYGPAKRQQLDVYVPEGISASSSSDRPVVVFWYGGSWMGHSAGAHIAAYLALNREFLAKRGAKPEWIVGLVGFSGPYALSPNTRTLNRIFAPPWGESDWQPVRFVSPTAPPTFLAHGLDDGLVSVGHTQKLRDALQAKGVRVETELYRDTGHGATVAGFSKPARGSAPTLDQTVGFLGSLTSTTSIASAAQTDPLH